MNVLSLIFAILLSGPVSTAGTQEETVVVTGSVTDIDGDTVPDGSDNCVLLANPQQEDLDSDNVGNPCDFNADGDNLVGLEDPCPAVHNEPTPGIVGTLKRTTFRIGRVFGGMNAKDKARQERRWAERDMDQQDECFLLDTDGDTLPDGQDRCPFWSTPPEQNADVDGDGLGDACDPHPNIPENRVKEPRPKSEATVPEPTTPVNHLGR